MQGPELHTTDQMVAFLRALRADGRIMMADSHLEAVRKSQMTRHDVAAKNADRLEQQLAALGVPRGVAEHAVHELRLAVLGPKIVYGNRDDFVVA